MINKLIKLADHFDQKKLYKKANTIDKLISIASEDDENVIDFLKEKARMENERQNFNRRMKMFSELAEDGDIVNIYALDGTWSESVDKYEMPEKLLEELIDSGMEIESFIEYLQNEGRSSDLNKIYVQTLT